MCFQNTAQVQPLPITSPLQVTRATLIVSHLTHGKLDQDFISTPSLPLTPATMATSIVPWIAAKLLKTEVRFCHSPLLKYPGASCHTQNKIPNLAAGCLVNPISCTLFPCSCSSLLFFGYTKHGLVSGPSHLLFFLPGKLFLSHLHCFLSHFIQAPVLKSPAYFI